MPVPKTKSAGTRFSRGSDEDERVRFTSRLPDRRRALPLFLLAAALFAAAATHTIWSSRSAGDTAPKGVEQAESPTNQGVTTIVFSSGATSSRSTRDGHLHDLPADVAGVPESLEIPSPDFRTAPAPAPLFELLAETAFPGDSAARIRPVTTPPDQATSELRLAPPRAPGSPGSTRTPRFKLEAHQITEPTIGILDPPFDPEAPTAGATSFAKTRETAQPPAAQRQESGGSSGRIKIIANGPAAGRNSDRPVEEQPDNRDSSPHAPGTKAAADVLVVAKQPAEPPVRLEPPTIDDNLPADGGRGDGPPSLAERFTKNVIGWRLAAGALPTTVTEAASSPAARGSGKPIKIVLDPKDAGDISLARRAANRRGFDPAPQPPSFFKNKLPTDTQTVASRPAGPVPLRAPKGVTGKPVPEKRLAVSLKEGTGKPIDSQGIAWRVLPVNGPEKAERTGLAPPIDLPPAPDFEVTATPGKSAAPSFVARVASAPTEPPRQAIAQRPLDAAPPAPDWLDGTTLAPPRRGGQQVSAPGAFRRDLAAKPITLVSVDITPASGDFPSEVRLPSDPTGDAPPLDSSFARGWAHSGYSWQATGLYHRPLYFEQTNLERYGYAPTRSRTGQSILAGAHFFGSMLILPYRLGAEPINDAVYTLGHYRPGSCVPYRFERPPLDWKGGALETVTIVGLIFAIP